ncbi:unnamed protein product [Hermetia illucens]|uniref:Uncharacterized protein n=1 Tax=Hermetia illucens TaxID=343691 RepID=A0A7R8YXH2_HERIL|nr:unnamed protein product [Hermetia illucens]
MPENVLIVYKGSLTSAIITSIMEGDVKIKTKMITKIMCPKKDKPLHPFEVRFYRAINEYNHTTHLSTKKEYFETIRLKNRDGFNQKAKLEYHQKVDDLRKIMLYENSLSNAIQN